VWAAVDDTYDIRDSCEDDGYILLRLYYDIIRLYYLMMLSGLLDNISGLHVALLSLCNDDYALWNWWVGLLYTICSTSTWLCGFA